MNAIDMLKEDHRIVESLFSQVEKTPPSEHVAIFKRIKGELDTHAHVEEVIFYPAVKKRGDKELVDMILEGFEEHAHMKMELAEIAKLTPKNERFEPKLKVMMELTRHHVKEEEREMFPTTEDQLGKEMLEKLGKQMQTEKDKFMKANKIKPEKRPAPGAIGAMVEKAINVVTGALGGKSRSSGTDTGKKTAAKAAPAKTKAKSSAGKDKPKTASRTGAGRTTRSTKERSAAAAKRKAAAG